VVIISTERNPVVTARAKKLNIPCIQGCEDKLGALKKVLADHKLTLAQAAFVGNDINDADCLKSVALPIVVHDAHEEVMPLARYRTLLPGGRGAVREVCDLFHHHLSKEKSGS